MKPVSMAICSFAAAGFFVGCADNSGRVSGVDQTTVHGSQGQELTLVKPSGVSLTRGEADKVSVHLKRKNFSEDVRVYVSQLPAGVEAVDSPRTTNMDSVELVLRASERAALVKNHQALLTAEGPEGIRATETIEINVRERS